MGFRTLCRHRGRAGSGANAGHTRREHPNRASRGVYAAARWISGRVCRRNRRERQPGVRVGHSERRLSDRWRAQLGWRAHARMGHGRLGDPREGHQSHAGSGGRAARVAAGASGWHTRADAAGIEAVDAADRPVAHARSGRPRRQSTMLGAQHRLRSPLRAAISTRDADGAGSGWRRRFRLPCRKRLGAGDRRAALRGRALARPQRARADGFRAAASQCN